MKGSGGPQFGAQGMSSWHMPSSGPPWREESPGRRELLSVFAGLEPSGRARHSREWWCRVIGGPWWGLREEPRRGREIREGLEQGIPVKTPDQELGWKQPGEEGGGVSRLEEQVGRRPGGMTCRKGSGDPQRCWRSAWGRTGREPGVSLGSPFQALRGGKDAGFWGWDAVSGNGRGSLALSGLQ